MTSPSNSNITFKISFLNNECEEEFRRFQIPQNYQTLLDKLESYHPGAEVESVHWVDDDGDEITVDCDDDLDSVIRESPVNVVKLRVRLRQERRVETSADQSGVLTTLVTTAQSLGLDPGTCHCDHVSGRSSSVTSYLLNLVTRISVKLTRSVIVMISLAMISVLSMILPSIIINTLVYIIIAASLGLPMATILLG